MLLKRAASYFIPKRTAERIFWQKEIARYQRWFAGELSPLYKTPSPADGGKVKAPNLKDSSILTWHKLHQEAKYLEDLKLFADSFGGMRLLDVGSGPMPSATCFKGCRLYCLEPLLPEYLKAGFPLHYYENAAFIHASSEEIPVEDGFFDAVISVNAIDHVDDFLKTASEIGRALKPGGLLRMHVHYHPPTRCEPISIDDGLFRRAFQWCGGLRKIGQSRSNFSSDLPEGESFALWSNFG